MNKYLTAPIKKEDAAKLRAGDYVYISGEVYTARDAAHERMDRALQNGEALPFDVTDNIRKGTTEIELHNKLILSIAIRLLFEKKLFNKFNDWNVVNGFTSNQTYELIDYCVNNNLLTYEEKSISEKVRIMVSENIHVNAFMYEPIIDMSDDELINLCEMIKKM